MLSLLQTGAICSVVGVVFGFGSGYYYSNKNCEEEKLKEVGKAVQLALDKKQKDHEAQNDSMNSILRLKETREKESKELLDELVKSNTGCTNKSNTCVMRALNAAAAGFNNSGKRILEECRQPGVQSKSNK